MPTCWIIARPNGVGKTTLAGHSYLRLVRRLRAGGWHVELIYLALCRCFMNSSAVPKLVFEQSGPVLNIVNTGLYEHLQHQLLQEQAP